MITRACTGMRITPPEDTAALTSLLIAISAGLMLQWLADPEANPRRPPNHRRPRPDHAFPGRRHQRLTDMVGTRTPDPGRSDVISWRDVN